MSPPLKLLTSDAVRSEATTDTDHTVSDNSRSNDEYRVGPGRPPKEHQFKKGQSGNPLGAKLKARSLAPDLKAMLQRMLHQKVRGSQGDQMLTNAAAGMQRLVDQFAGGDRHARRDLIQICEKLGIDLTAGQRDMIQNSVAAALTQNDQALVDDYVRHHVAELEAQQRQEDNSGLSETSSQE